MYGEGQFVELPSAKIILATCLGDHVNPKRVYGPYTPKTATGA